MPVRAPDRPTISCVYAAFDAECQRIFRRAMELSTGSIVRVGDLVLALAELARPAGAGVVPDGWQPPPRPASREPWLTPMSNEPALRTWLEQAYLLVCECERPVVIHPRKLWESAANLGHLPQILPNSPVARPVRPAAISQPRSPVAAPISVESLIDQTVNRWVLAHAGSDQVVRNADVEQLRPLVQQVETREATRITSG